MRFAVGNAQDIGARPEQEDSFGFSDPRNQTFVAHGGLLGVVADGMGGLSHGSEASRSAVRTFLGTYELKSAGESIPEALKRSLLEANRAVLALAAKSNSPHGVGTTLAAVVLHQNSLYWISAGDSRIYLLHGDRLTQITADHVYAKELNQKVAAGRLSRAEAQNDSERDAVTSYLGKRDLAEIDCNRRPFPLLPGERVILCSDGFYHALSEKEITAAFSGKMQAACEDLVRQAVAKHREHQDNLTVIGLMSEVDSAVQSRKNGGRLSRVLGWGLLVLILLLLVFGAGFLCGTRYGPIRALEQRTLGSTQGAGRAK